MTQQTATWQLKLALGAAKKHPSPLNLKLLEQAEDEATLAGVDCAKVRRTMKA